MDAAALAGLEDDLVEPEGADPELGAQALEALAGLGIQARRGGALLHGGAS
jgi:hypothetical protein